MAVCWSEALLVAFFVCLPFLYDTRREFRYRFRAAVFFASASVASLPAAFRFKRRNRIIAYLGRQISRLLSLEWSLRGKQNLSTERTSLAVVNYQTDVDALGFLHLQYCEKNELNIISESNFSNLWPFTFFPWLLSLALCPIQYFNGKFGLLRFSQNVTDSEPTLLLTSTAMTKEETVKMALKRKLPIQPIVFSNRYFINKQKHLFEPGRIIISVLPMIETESLSERDINEFVDELSTKINVEYDSISKITELSDYQTPYS